MKNKLGWIFAALIAASGFSAGAAAAAPISYIFTGTATGTLAGQAFSGLLTLTASGDSTTITPLGIALQNALVTTVIDTPGLGSVTVTNPDYVFVRQDVGVAGYGVHGIPTCCDIIQLTDPAIFMTYDLTSDTTSIIQASDPSIAAWTDVPTTGGLMTLTSFENFSFQSILTPTGVPEPGIAGLFAAGLAGLGLLRRRRAAA